MRILRWLVEELKAIAGVTLYFAACFVLILLMKHFWLEEYGIRFTGIAAALVAALVTAKVIIVLDHVPLTRWLGGAPGIVSVVVRSAVYTAVVLVVMLLEKAFEARAEYGGFTSAVANIFHHPELPQLYATMIAVGLSFLAYNVFELMRQAVGGDRMVELFLSRRVPPGRHAQGA
jgi:hypothetical protein